MNNRLRREARLRLFTDASYAEPVLSGRGEANGLLGMTRSYGEHLLDFRPAALGGPPEAAVPATATNTQKRERTQP